MVLERGSVPAPTRDGDLWDSDFNDFQCFGIGGLKKKFDTKKSSIILLVLRVSDFFFFAGEDQVYVRFICFPSRVLLPL